MSSNGNKSVRRKRTVAQKKSIRARLTNNRNKIINDYVKEMAKKRNAPKTKDLTITESDVLSNQ